MSEPASAEPAVRPFRGWLLLPLLAALAMVPLLRAGGSCGHDFAFHLESWLDAAAQLRHGTVYPAWDFHAAWNAGEPRFLFYPPLSWTLGELLTSALPFRAVPLLYTWLVLSAAGVSMYLALRRLAVPQAALLAAAVYLANPYMLFTATERTAFAELLAAVWFPWLLLALLRPRPTVASVAIPYALLWLTNAPAAVMGSYILALLGLVRVVLAAREQRQAAERSQNAFPLATTYTLGALLGLGLAGVFLVPALYERRFVQIAMALSPELSFPSNFLFKHIGDAAHDHVINQASVIAVALLAAAVLVLLASFRRTRQLLSTREAEALPTIERVALLALAAAAVAFLLEPLSTPLWAHVPELAFLQFPWRFLMVLSAALAFALALLAGTLRLPRPAPLALVLVALVALLAWPAEPGFLQACPAEARPTTAAELFRNGHGVEPTDEYTPNAADNDFLRSDDPGFWLATTPDAPAPGTVPNPNANAPDVDFGTPPPSQTLSDPAPHDLRLHLTRPTILVLNLRDFHAWHVTVNGSPNVRHIRRPDGLVALQLPPGDDHIEIRWRLGPDRILGVALSLVAAILLAAARLLPSRKISAEHAV